MKIVFMGTPEFAVPSLEILVKNNLKIDLIVTQPDRPRGRGHKVTFCPVKSCAIENNLPVIQPEKIGSAECVEQLRKLEPDLFVTCAFGQFLTGEVLQIPKLGTINVHGSLLPKYRGAAPIHWAIINGEKKTGVTTMLTALKLDTGDILLSKEIEIHDDMTTGQLHDKMSIVGAELLLETIQQLEKGNIKPIPQNEAEATYAPRISRDTGKIVWDNSAISIHNLVRGTNPWPVAYAYLNGERMRICKTIVYDKEKVTGSEPGTIIDTNKDGFLVQAGKGIIKVFEVQCDNSRRMTVEEYICGHTLNQGECFEYK